MNVIWSVEAKVTYNKELEFIFSKWSISEVAKFIHLVEEFVEKLKNGILRGKRLNNNIGLLLFLSKPHCFLNIMKMNLLLIYFYFGITAKIQET